MSQKLANATALYLDGIRDGRVREAVEAYTGDRYTQHSTGVRDGVEGFVEFFEPFIERNPVRDIEVVRSIVDGSFVFVHVFQDINNGEARWVTTDMFDTDENDKIVEHWDVIAAYRDEPSVNGHTQIDGPTEIVDEDKTVQNKALVASFVDEVLVAHRTERISDYVSADTYIQHNPMVADGIEAFEAFMAGPGKDMVYRNVFKIIGQGNLVMAYSHVFLEQELAVFDLFRLESGKIVEHWDNMESLPEGTQPNSGKF
jgi:predicted SnoaL-like aldol condensation-catalyzing enzyme